MSNKFYVQEQFKEKFYQLPKVFFTSPDYQKLSNDSKITYAILRDRLDLSIKNNWVDSDNAIYFVYTIDKLTEILNLSKPTVIKIKKELESVGLLEQKRQGFNRPNKLYLMKPKVTNDDIYEISKSENDVETHENKVENSVEASRSKEVKNFNLQKLNNFTTGSKKSLPPEVKNFNPNDTDFNKTDFNKTEFNETGMNGMSGNNNISTTENHNHSNHSIHVNKEQLIDEQNHLLKPMPKELQQFIKSRYTTEDGINIANKIMQAKKSASYRRDDSLFFYFEENEELADVIMEILIAVNREMKKKEESVQAMLGYYYNALVNGLEEYHFTSKARTAVKNNQFNNIFN